MIWTCTIFPDLNSHNIPWFEVAVNRSELVANQEVNAWLNRDVFKFFLNDVIESLDRFELGNSYLTLYDLNLNSHNIPRFEFIQYYLIWIHTILPDLNSHNTWFEKTRISSLKDSEEHTSPPAMRGSRGVHVASSHFSKMSARSGNSGWLQCTINKRNVELVEM